jgi:hypothetical protein
MFFFTFNGSLELSKVEENLSELFLIHVLIFFLKASFFKAFCDLEFFDDSRVLFLGKTAFLCN